MAGRTRAFGEPPAGTRSPRGFTPDFVLFRNKLTGSESSRLRSTPFGGYDEGVGGGSSSIPRLSLNLQFHVRQSTFPHALHSFNFGVRVLPGETKMAWYAYCITEQQGLQNGTRARRPFALENLRGVNGASVLAYPSGDFAVIVSDHSPEQTLTQQAISFWHNL
jgi:hypothetical protein